MDAKKLRDTLFDSLQDAAQLLRLFDFLPNVYLYVKDRQGRFVAVNENQSQLRGLGDQSQFWGKTDLDIHPAYWGLKYQEEDRRVMEGGREIPHQVWLVPVAKGRLGTFISSKIPLRGKRGDVIGIAGVMYRIDSDGEHHTRSDPVEKATGIIGDQFSGPLSVAEIAAAVGLSVSQLNRRFRSKYKIPPSEYLQRVRVYQASRLLTDSDLSIIAVALRCGFYDQAHLSRMFRKWMNVSPKDFRRQSKQPGSNTSE
jgi:AraC-like DNA-binding protein